MWFSNILVAFFRRGIYTYYIFNILIYLSEQSGDVLSPILKSGMRGVIIMSTYEEFMVLLTTASLIVAILNFAHKK